jgi:methyltransferase-like protein/SAM-dependent methyltransferase
MLSGTPLDLPASTSEKTSYDKVPYKSYPFRQSHPAHLATVGILLGVHPPKLSNCRVLEIGCASGGNIIPLADQMPDCEFTGIDLSSTQISAGNALIESASLSNVKLLNMDVRSLSDALGDFDFIIAHGVYSWIPRDAQDALLAVCGERLRSNGLAYVSYNTYPGWRMRGMVRDMMGYHTRKPGRPEDQVRKARALLHFLAQTVPTDGNPYGLLLNQELQQLQDKEDYYLLHEHLEDVNEPVYFSEFAARAESAGLSYVGEADYSSMSLDNLNADAAALLKTLASDIVETEQYMDFIRNRMFRQTILCRKEMSLDRTLDPDRLRSLYVCSPTRPQEPIRSLSDNSPVVFESGSSITRTTDPLVKAALSHLGRIWPASIAFNELTAISQSLISGRASFVDCNGSSPEAYRLAVALERCFATGHVELSVKPHLFDVEVSENPYATATTRTLAASQPIVTNARHESVQLTNLEQLLLTKLTGKKNLDEIVNDLHQLMLDGGLSVHDNGELVRDPGILKNIASEQVRDCLAKLARKALLVKSM